MISIFLSSTFFQTYPLELGSKIQRTENSRRNATAPGAATAKPHMAAIPVPSNARGIRPSVEKKDRADAPFFPPKLDGSM